MLVCGITYITLSYYVTFLTYIYNSCKYIYEKILLLLILSIICNALRNFVQPFAYKGVYNDLLQPHFLTFRTYVTRLYRPLPWTSRTSVLLVTPNRGYFQTIRIYDFRTPGIADTPHTPTTPISLYLIISHHTPIYIHSHIHPHILSYLIFPYIPLTPTHTFHLPIIHYPLIHINHIYPLYPYILIHPHAHS